MSSPSSRTSPASAADGIISCIRFRIRRKVDLPQPEGPMSAVTCRAGMTSVTSSSTLRSPNQAVMSRPSRCEPVPSPGPSGAAGPSTVWRGSRSLTATVAVPPEPERAFAVLGADDAVTGPDDAESGPTTWVASSSGCPPCNRSVSGREYGRCGGSGLTMRGFSGCRGCTDGREEAWPGVQSWTPGHDPEGAGLTRAFRCSAAPDGVGPRRRDRQRVRRPGTSPADDRPSSAQPRRPAR